MRNSIDTASMAGAIGYNAGMGERRSIIAVNGSHVRRIRERTLRISQGELADRASLSEPLIGKIERGEKKTVTATTFYKLVNALGISEEEAMDVLTKGFQIPAPSGFKDQNVEPYSEEKLGEEPPMFDLSVAAGSWADVSDVAEFNDPRRIDMGVFRIRIRGDSMMPRFKEGDIVEFRCLRDGKDELTTGSCYYVQRDGEATFKCLEKFDEEQYTFRALNKRKYPEPIVVRRTDVSRMAKALNRIDPIK